VKILFCHNVYQTRGGEDHNFILQKKLLESKGHQVISYTRDNREICDYNIVKKMGLLLNVFFSFDTYRKIKTKIKEEKPDIVYVHNIYPLLSPAVYYAAYDSKVPVVQRLPNYRLQCANGLFLRNNGSICERCADGNFWHAILGRCYRNSYFQSSVMAFVLYFHRKWGTFKKIDVFIAPSRFVLKKIKDSGFRGQVVYISNFINVTNISERHVESKGNVFCYFGRLSSEKGLGTLLKAVKGLDIQLRIIGEGPMRQKLEDEVRKENLFNVIFMGYKSGDELYQEIEASVATIFPSEWYEVFGLSVIESFAWGKPVIGARIGALPELICDEQTGLTFIPGVVEDLKEKIQRLLADPGLAERMGRTAREFVVAHCSADAYYAALMTVFQNTIDKHKKICLM
jgi:glycosyltransferase involved in cell wall biosynthesis